jgi:hypothetical protein
MMSTFCRLFLSLYTDKPFAWSSAHICYFAICELVKIVSGQF